MFFRGPISENKVRMAMLITFTFLCFSIMLLGCGPRSNTESRYVPKATENDVWIFEYEPGIGTYDKLTLFLEALDKFTKKYPEVVIVRIQGVHTNENNVRTNIITATSVLVYTQIKGKS